MIVGLDSVRDELQIKIVGTESWLHEVSTPLANDGILVSGEPITGDLTMKKTNNGLFLDVTGEVRFRASVRCQNCGDAFELNIREPIKATFRPMPHALTIKKTYDLSAQELDEYYFENGNGADLSVLINDAVQLSLPTNATCESALGKPCEKIDRKTDEILVRSESSNQGKPNPFSVLKGLKVEDEKNP